MTGLTHSRVVAAASGYAAPYRFGGTFKFQLGFTNSVLTTQSVYVGHMLSAVCYCQIKAANEQDDRRTDPLHGSE